MGIGYYHEGLDELAREALAKQLERAKDWTGIPAAYWRALLKALIKSDANTRLDELESLCLVARDEENEDILNEGEFWICGTTHGTRDIELNIDGIIQSVAEDFGLSVLDFCGDGDSFTRLIGSLTEGEAAKRYVTMDCDDGAVLGAFDTLAEALAAKAEDCDIVFDREQGKKVDA